MNIFAFFLFFQFHGTGRWDFGQVLKITFDVDFVLLFVLVAHIQKYVFETCQV